MHRHPDPVRVGPDEVRFGLGCIYVHAVREMDGWDIREFQRRAIYFQGTKYYLYARSPDSRPYAVCYELRHWPAEHQQESSQGILYDEAYVTAREAEEIGERKSAKVHWAAYPWQPLLGFLWQSVKTDRLAYYGLNPRGMTIGSLYLMGALIVIELSTLCWLKHGFFEVLLSGRTEMYDWALVIVLLLDVTMRAGRMLVDHDVAPGFYEWLVTKPRF